MFPKFKTAHKWNMADTVTTIRIGVSALLIFLSLETNWFLVIYTFAGLTDAVDGWIAIRTGKASEFGARLDSIAESIYRSDV